MIDWSGSDLCIALHKSRLNMTDISRLAECSRPTVYSWREAKKLPHKAAFLVEKIEEGLTAGRLPLKGTIPPSERPRIAKFAVYGE